jgi:hypothetical protein
MLKRKARTGGNLAKMVARGRRRLGDNFPIPEHASPPPRTAEVEREGAVVGRRDVPAGCVEASPFFFGWTRR